VTLLDSAVRLYHKREREQIDRFFDSFDSFRKTGKHKPFENTNVDKIWTWAYKRWKNFPYREYELRQKHE
jgi:hypothetical protein